MLAGRNDDIVPWASNEELDSLLPNSELHALDAGHDAWEESTGRVRPSRCRVDRRRLPVLITVGGPRTADHMDDVIADLMAQHRAALDTASAYAARITDD